MLEAKRRTLSPLHMDTLNSKHKLVLLRYYIDHMKYVSFHATSKYFGPHNLDKLMLASILLREVSNVWIPFFGDDYHLTKDFRRTSMIAFSLVTFPIMLVIEIYSSNSAMFKSNAATNHLEHNVTERNSRNFSCGNLFKNLGNRHYIVVDAVRIFGIRTYVEEDAAAQVTFGPFPTGTVSTIPLEGLFMQYDPRVLSKVFKIIES